MRIVDTDNFGRDYPDEKFLAWVDSEHIARPARFYADEASRICEALNGQRENSPRYYKAVADDYTLSPGFEP